MNNPQKGNRLILLVTALVLAGSSLFIQWGVLTVREENLPEMNLSMNGQSVAGGALDGLLGAMMLGREIPVTGLNGHLPLGPVTIPFWLPVGAVIAGILFTVTNQARLSAVPRKLMLALMACGVVAGVWAGIILLSEGTVGVGGFLLVTASVIGWMQQKHFQP